MGIANDDYTEAGQVGLTDSRAVDLNGNLSALVSTASTLHVFLDHQMITSNQAGSNAFSVPDWFARTRDTVKTAGVGMTHRFAESPFEIGAEYAVSQSQGNIRVNVASFPALETTLHSVLLHTTYQRDDGGNIRAEYRYEEYSASDWMLDGVDPATVSNVILLGEETPSYDVHVLMLSTRLHFD